MTSHLPFSLPMDFPVDEDSPDMGDLSKKKIPKELTSHGTTPLGKPRVFVCNTCTRAFARLEHLRRHERSHTKEKPFTCGVCQRKFSRRDLLLRHAQKLHAGCADAITRLRRKLIKGNSIGSQDMFDESVFRGLSVSTPSLAEASLKRDQPPPAMLTPSSSQRGSIDSVNFNLNLFSRGKDSKERSRQNSIKELALHKQIFDLRKLGRDRGASFSAQSGANYALARSDYPDVYPGTDTVEFLTPQLLPTTIGEEQSWLSNLLTIPGMSEGFKNSQRADLVALLSLDNEIPTHTSIFGPLGGNLLRSDSVGSTNSFNTEPGAPPFPGMSRNGSLNKTNGSTAINTNDVADYGYSFYDIPDSMTNKGYNGIKMNAPLSPIKQELEDELMDMDNGGFNTTGNTSMIPAAITNGVNFDLNFLNDIDELGQDFDGGSKFLPNGYSFYGDNPSVSSSGMESTSPPHILSPTFQALLRVYGKSSSGQQPLRPSHLNEIQSLNEKPPNDHSVYSSTTLFTKNMRYMINKSLSKYPISGIMTPSIPSNEKLELYLRNFVTMFLSHFPFIHPSKLNEQEIMNMTANEDANNESARVCMPLLVATIGALLANNKNDSEHLYEASRRTIHIYLESRKNSVGDTNSAASNQSVNPLWLIQSLTLSVIYGLFSDNENNVYIVIRQLNALNSLVKTSIKSNRVILFSINGEEENSFNVLHSNPSSLIGGSQFSKDIKFRYNINMQSQVRIVFMIYRLTNFILMMYNVPLTLSINDLGNMSCPNIYDEFLWHFNSHDDFMAHLNSLNSSNDLEFYLARDDANTIVFKDLLVKLSKSDFDPSLVTRLSNLSKFGFSSAVHGIFEIKQYEEMKYVDVYAILDNLTLFIDNAKNNNNTRYALPTSTDFEKLDYALLVNFVKICATIDFKLVKEQSWLRNYDELANNFHKFMVYMESVDDFEYLKVIDCCIVIIKLALFKTDDAESDSVGKSEIFQSELSFLANNSSPGNFGSLVNDSLQHQYNTSANFEKLTNWKVFDEIDPSKHSIHSQMLFHVFAILSIFAVFIAKRNNQGVQLGRDSNANNTRQFNQRFIVVLRLLAKIEGFLRAKYQNSNVDTDLTNLYLFSSFNNDETLLDQGIDMKADDSAMNVLLNNQNYFAYNLEKALYVLKIGELMLRYLYDTNIKVCIFKKLSGSLSQLRKYLVDEESRILT